MSLILMKMKCQFFICMKVVIQHVFSFAILGLASLIHVSVNVEVQIELDMIIAIDDAFSHYILHVPV